VWHLDESDAESTIRPHVGDLIIVRLPGGASGGYHRPRSSDPDVVLRRHARGGFPAKADAVGRFRVVGHGRADLTSYDDFTCLHARPSCEVPQRVWTVHVKVRRAPATARPALLASAARHDGDLDPAFGSHGVRRTALAAGGSVVGTAVQRDGKVVVATATSGQTGFDLTRFTAGGNLDIGFGSQGRVTTSIPGYTKAQAQAVAVQPDGRIVVVGWASNSTNADFAVARYLPTGKLDRTFANHGTFTIGLTANNDFARAVAIQRDGRILVAGVAHFNTSDDTTVIRLTKTGAWDKTFNDLGGEGGVASTTGRYSDRNDAATTMRIAHDGDIVIGGYETESSHTNGMVVELTSAGAFDMTFGDHGIQVVENAAVSSDVTAVAPLRDGRLLVGGVIHGPDDHSFLFRLHAGGTPDGSFQAAGINGSSVTSDTVRTIDVQPNGKFVTTGNVVDSNGTDVTVYRHNQNGSADSSFGTAGVPRIAVSGAAGDSAGAAIDSAGRIVVAGLFAGSSSTQQFVARVLGDTVRPHRATVGHDKRHGTKVRVHWHATDDNTGVASYDVQRRTDSGHWKSWHRRTSARSAAWQGKRQHRYCFRARARDHAGNVGSYSAPTCVRIPAHG
ncbi:MAG: hypothetical protein JO222_01215, partial [Frankiales bacterium]|nr:hypothetical protein [Frankiales bacterium]